MPKPAKLLMWALLLIAVLVHAQDGPTITIDIPPLTPKTMYSIKFDNDLALTQYFDDDYVLNGEPVDRKILIGGPDFDIPYEAGKTVRQMILDWATKEIEKQCAKEQVDAK